jgi:drug/metabolite transporter (DMT)-like permease
LSNPPPTTARGAAVIADPTPAGHPAGVSVSGRGQPTARDRHLAEAAVLVVMVLWAGNFVVVKAAVAALPPIGFTFLRFVLASLTLLVLLRWREGGIGLPRRDLITLLVLGGLGFGVYQMLWTTGITTVPAGDSALIIAATPVLVAVLAVVAGSDVLTPTKLAGVLMSFAGVAIVIGSGSGLSLGGSLLGEALTFGAAVCWAIFTAFSAPLLRRHSPLRSTAWASTAGTVVLAPVALAQLSGVQASAFTLEVGGAILYSGFLAAGISNVVVQHGVKLIGPTRTSAFQFLVPALAVVLAAAFLSEPIRGGQILGGVVIVAGILVTRAGGRLGDRLRRRSDAEEPGVGAPP